MQTVLTAAIMLFTYVHTFKDDYEDTDKGNIFVGTVVFALLMLLWAIFMGVN